jgi:hypothetical protein
VSVTREGYNPLPKTEGYCQDENRRKKVKIYDLKNTFCMLILCFSISAQDVTAKITLSSYPGDINPQRIEMDNDSLHFAFNVDWRLEAYSLVYKPKNVEFIQRDRPMPLAAIDNSWSLNNVGFAIRTVAISRSSDSVQVHIHAQSNYLENPFHLFIDLSMYNRAEIKAKIWLENRHQIGFHDIYRERSTLVVPGIPWLAFLSPQPNIHKRFLYPAQDGYILEKVDENIMADYKPVQMWERPPRVGPITLQFYRDPAVPTTVEFRDLNMGAFLFRQKSDLNWTFPGIKEALWPSQNLTLAKQDTVVIFNGLLRLFQGDWHQSFYWLRNHIRKNFDFTYYRRPGFQKYRTDFLAYHSFVFNNMLYDPATNRIEMERFLKKSKYEFDGFDQFYLWHAYPRVGTDPRDQFDLFADMPGGLAGLKEIIGQAHQMGTHVYLAYNPWDKIGQRQDMYEEMAKIVGATSADGLLLDTMGKSDLNFRIKIDQYNPDAQFVTEGRPGLDGLAVTTTSWDHPRKSQPMPRVDLLRFILPEHRAFQIVRWDRDRTPLIKKAFFNATGYTVWDDIFGEINLQSWDEKILISRYHRIMHDFSSAVNSVRCEPLIPTEKDELFVNGFYAADQYLFTLFQANHADVSHFFDNRIIGPVFEATIPEKWHLVDVWNKRPVELKEQHIIYFPYEMPEDVGCVVAMPELITVEQSNGEWSAGINKPVAGTLELVGVDIGLRNQLVKEVNAGQKLQFSRADVQPSPDGYAMVQYRNQDKEVKDVVLVKVGY